MRQAAARTQHGSVSDSSKRFREAAQEIDMLRALVDRQLSAMNNTPMNDMNHAGIEWRRAAEKQRGIHDQTI